MEEIDGNIKPCSSVTNNTKSKSDPTRHSFNYGKWYFGTHELLFENSLYFHGQEQVTLTELKASVKFSAFDLDIPFIFSLRVECDPTSKVGGEFSEDSRMIHLIAGREVHAEIVNDIDWGFKDYVDLEWSIPNANFHFSLVKLHFYSDDNKLAFTKYLHLDQFRNQADCGCELHHPFARINDTQCEEYNTVYEKHVMTVTTKFYQFCTMKEIESLQKSVRANSELKNQLKFNEKTQIRVVADFVLGQKNDKVKYWTNTKDNVNLDMEEITKSVVVPCARRQEILNDATRKADIAFILSSGERISAHKDVLMEGRSEMLKTMMESDMLETKSGEIPVTDESFTFSIFQDFLNGLYGGWTDDETERNCENFKLLFARLKICDYYSAHQLFDLNIGIIIGNPHPVFTTWSALEMYKCGCIYNIPCHKIRCLQWLEYKREFISFHDKLLDDLKEEVQDLIRVLQNSYNIKPLQDFLKTPYKNWNS